MKTEFELMYEAAHLYYKMELTQQEIAERLFTSRSRISRLIDQAKKAGIVEIRVSVPSGKDRNRELESALAAIFGLKNVCVVEAGNLPTDLMFDCVAAAAATHLTSVLKNGSVFGVSWGHSIYKTILALQPRAVLPDMHIVQMMGSIEGSTPEIDGPDLVRRASEAFQCKYSCLMSPMVVEDPHTHRHLRQRPAIAEVISAAEHADVCCTGIGTVSSWVPYISPDVNQVLLTKAAVGRICGFYFNKGGQLIDTPIHQQIIGVSCEGFRSIPNRIAVASGEEKVQAILGALRGQFISTLVTDSHTAAQVLKFC